MQKHTLIIEGDVDVAAVLDALDSIDAHLSVTVLGAPSFESMTGVPPDHVCFDRGQHDPDGPGLRPGERVVGGRLLYSAAWL